MSVVGKMEVIIKISEFPEDVKTVTNNWKKFVIEADDKQITITTRPKMFTKIEQAKQQFPQWVAAINGKKVLALLHILPSLMRQVYHLSS